MVYKCIDSLGINPVLSFNLFQINYLVYKHCLTSVHYTFLKVLDNVNIKKKKTVNNIGLEQKKKKFFYGD